MAEYTSFLSIFYFKAEKYSTIHIYHNFFIHLFVNRHRGCFHILTIMNNAAMNMEIQISLCGADFISFSYPEVRLLAHVAVPFLIIYGNTILFFMMAGRLHSQEKHTSVLFSPHAQEYLSFNFLMTVILTILRWYFTGIFLCISLIISDVDDVFMYQSAIFMSLETCLRRTFAHF